jgi:hypothetical protein
MDDALANVNEATRNGNLYQEDNSIDSVLWSFDGKDQLAQRVHQISICCLIGRSGQRFDLCHYGIHSDGVYVKAA